MEVYILPKEINYKHIPSTSHIEHPHRLDWIEDELKRLNVKNIHLNYPKSNLKFIALVDELATLVHEHQTLKSDNVNDTYISKTGLKNTLYTSQYSYQLVSQVYLSHNHPFNFIATRPPNHHAWRQHANGFCWYNAICITAALHLLKNPDEQVVIYDFDYHHGFGSEMFVRKLNTYFLQFSQEQQHRQEQKDGIDENDDEEDDEDDDADNSSSTSGNNMLSSIANFAKYLVKNRNQTSFSLLPILLISYHSDEITDFDHPQNKLQMKQANHLPLLSNEAAKTFGIHRRPLKFWTQSLNPPYLKTSSISQRPYQPKQVEEGKWFLDYFLPQLAPRTTLLLVSAGFDAAHEDMIHVGSVASRYHLWTQAIYIKIATMLYQAIKQLNSNVNKKEQTIMIACLEGGYSKETLTKNCVDGFIHQFAKLHH